MCIYEKLRRIHVCLKEEENACQLLGAVAVSALSRSFDMAVEAKTGISKLELYYEELSREERLKEQRKAQKKLKKRRKRNERRHVEEEEEVSCGACEEEDDDDDNESVVDEVCECRESDASEESHSSSCRSCEEETAVKDGGQTSIDGGYVSEHGSSLNNSPEGSEVACSDGLCNHHDRHTPEPTTTTATCCSKYYAAAGFTCTLEQMLNNNDDDDTATEPEIPTEYILEFQSKHKNVKQERQELRQRLLTSFNRLCGKPAQQQIN